MGLVLFSGIAATSDSATCPWGRRLEALGHQVVLLKMVTQRPARMWGPGIVGYGSYRYSYDSGRTGEAPLAGFAIRGRELVVYLVAEGDKQKSLLSKLGKHKMGKACLYFKQLADLDKSVLKQLVTNSVAEVRRRYG